MIDLASFRHALRTRLNHIIGYSEMLVEEAVERGASDELSGFRDIRAAAQELLKLVQAQLAPSLEFLPETGLARLRQDAYQPLAIIEQRASEFTGPDVDRIARAAENLRGCLENPPRDSAAASNPATIPSVHSGRLLVVDDDATNRDILSRQLAKQGYLIETARGGPDALELMALNHYDVVLLDLIMPGMDGFEALSAMKANIKLRSIPVIMISALDEMASVSRCIEAGADDFISKPFDRVILASRIGAVVRRGKMELERAELAERLELLLESTSEGIFGVDRSGKCTFINGAALMQLGYQRDEILGRRIHDLIHYRHPDGSPYLSQEGALFHAIHSGESKRVTSDMLYRKGGEAFPVDYSASPITHEGEIIGAVALFSDISERKLTEEKFRQTAKLESLGVLAGGIAHDFNNLLTGILGNASLVLWSDALAKTDREKLEFIVQSSERAADLTKQMLAYAGKGKIEVRSVLVSNVIRDTASLLATMIPKTVRLHLDLSDTSPIEGDPSQIQQVAMNLVINAGESIGEPYPGTITVQTREELLDVEAAQKLGAGELAAGLYVVLEVADTGCGMGPEVQARIFDPFYSTKFTGRGLGLAAVHGIVTGHRGAIRVLSSPGAGSRFQVYVPAATQKLATVVPAKIPEWKAGVSGRVMIIDDEEMILKTTQGVLRSSGFETVVVNNGEDAIALFKQEHAGISVVLLDMMMPGMGGDEVLRYLRVIRRDIPVIVTSGYTEEQVMRYFSGRRVSAFLQKPYRSDALIEIVGRVVQAATAS
jgi:two-component system, cell cycle sensor histidine kinase and response regulator CckA